MPHGLIFELILIITAAFLGGFFARSLSLPPLLGYITSGIIFGVIGRNFFESYTSLIALSQLGISLLLFTLGFEIKIDSLLSVSKKVLFIGVIQVLITGLLSFFVFSSFGFTFNTAVLLGMVTSFSSTAVIVKLLEEKGLLNDFPGNNVLVILIIQDLFVVPAIFLLPVLFSKSGMDLKILLAFFLTSVKALAVFSGILVISKVFLTKFLNLIFRYPIHELTILATIFVSAISIGILVSIGLPEAIAAFLAGVIVSEEGKNLAPLSEIRPIRDIFLVLFFVMSGMFLDLSFLSSHLLLVLSLTFILLSEKFLIVFSLLKITRFLTSANVFISSHLTNIGEFAIIIGQIAFVSGYINKNAYDMLLSIFILSLLSIPIFTANIYNFGPLSSLPFIRSVRKERNLSIGDSDELSNHVIICGHGRVGKEVRSLLDFGVVPYVVIDFDRSVINELLLRKKRALYADPSDFETLKSANLEHAKVLVVAVPDPVSQRRIIKSAVSLNPKITIICRSHSEEDKKTLFHLGADSIIVPEFEAGVRIGREVLDVFGTNEESVINFVGKERGKS